MREHRVFGTPVMPGALMLELAAMARGERAGSLHGVTFLRSVREGDEIEILADAAGFRLLAPGSGLLLAEGRFGPAAPLGPPRIDASRALEPVEPAALYRWFSGLGISYGPRFQTITAAWRGPGRVRALLDARHGEEGFFLDPCLLDGALQTLGVGAFGAEGALFLPFAIDRLSFSGPLPRAAEVWAEVQQISPDALSATMELRDRAGLVVARLEGVALRRVQAVPLFVPRALPASPVAPKAGPPPCYGDRAAIARFRGLPGPAELPDRLVYFAGTDRAAVPEFLAFAQRWLAAPGRRRLDVVASAGSPESEAVLGAVRALRLEESSLVVRGVATEPGVLGPALWAELEAAEPEIWLSPTGRRRRRLVGAQPSEIPLRLEGPGAVVISGGLSGIGLELAAWLRRRFDLGLILLSRRGPTEAARARLGEIQDDRCLARALDVRDPGAVEAVLEEGRGRLGPLLGVVHGAALLRDGLLRTKSREDLEAVLGPKLDGVVALDRATAQDPLRFFLLLSSLVSYTGNLGQTDYAAANRYLDAYARRRRAEGRPFQSLAFGPWAEIGMAKDLAARARAAGIEPLSPALGLRAIEAAMTLPEAEIVIAPVADRLLELADSRGAQPKVEPAPPVIVGPPSLDLSALLLQQIAGFLEIDAEHLDTETDLAEYGVDSIMAAQLLRALEEKLGRSIPPSLLFEARTISALAARLGGAQSEASAAAPEPPAPAPTSPAVERSAKPSPGAIAVIGFAARVPGAPDLEAFFDGLLAGKSWITEVPASRFDVRAIFDPGPPQPGKTRSKWGAFIPELERFDPLFFGISPREAAAIDPQQRLLLDLASGALEHAGYGPRLEGSETGVFVAGAQSGYQDRLAPGTEAHAATGNAPSILANRISHALDLRGPSLVVDAACSSSLVALHLAMQSLALGESKQALVGAVNVLLDPRPFIAGSQALLLSPSGRSAPFSSAADGYVRSEAAVMLLLKPYAQAIADGDTIHGILSGSAVTQDGHTASLTTPDVGAELRAMEGALCGRPLDYVEAHAVGSPLADAAERSAIDALGHPQLIIGALKGSTGHSELASGLLSVLKLLLAYARGVIPPAHSEGAPTDPRLLTRPLALPEQHRALVNAFGFGGTNASVYLERPPPVPPRHDSPGSALLLVSARTEALLAETRSTLAAHLGQDRRHDFADLAHSVSTGRRTGPFRLALEGDRAALIQGLEREASRRATKRPRLAFAFTGQGAQYGGMAKGLLAHHQGFRAAFERVAEGFDRRLPRPLHAVIEEGGAALDETLYTQPALFAIAWALAEIWRAAGIRPDVVLGHSIGELAAATVAGALPLEQATELVIARAQALQALPRVGAMAAILAGEAELLTLMAGVAEVEVAAYNAPRNLVIAGARAGVEEILSRAAAAGLRSKRLAVSHAFHSALVEPAAARLLRDAAQLSPAPLQIPLASTVDARVFGPEAKLDAAYFSRQIRAPVRFAEALRAAAPELVLEIGPDGVLTNLVRAIDDSTTSLPSLQQGQDERSSLRAAAKALFLAGFDLDPSALLGERRRQVPLPPSARAPLSLWPAPASVAPRPAAPSLPRAETVLLEELCALLRIEPADIDREASVRSLGLDSLLGMELAARVQGRLQRTLPQSVLSDDPSIAELAALLDEVPASADASRAAPIAADDSYARFARPATMENLRAAGLDKIYVGARGDLLLAEEQGRVVEILDVLGGFGCTLFGHNHPSLVAAARGILDRGVAVHAQGAHHQETGRLAKALSEALDPRRRFISTFGSTGSEAVELAIKHAELEYAARQERFERSEHQAMSLLLHRIGDVRVDPELAVRFSLPGAATLRQLILAVEDEQRRIWAEKAVFCALQRAYHGKTSGAARLGDGAPRRGLGLEVVRLSADHPEALAAALAPHRKQLPRLIHREGRLGLEEVPHAAILGIAVEPVQGEGGVHPLSRPMIQALRAAADRDGFPILADEIQSGFGRCGAFCAAEALGLRADYYLFGKALGGGLAKLSVLMVDAERYVPAFGLAATSTFSEDDPSILLGQAALELYHRDQIAARARDLGAALKAELETLAAAHPTVFRAVRGLGLLIGLELADLSTNPSPLIRLLERDLGMVAASWFLNAARIRFLPSSSATNTIRIEPSAYLGEEHRAELVAALGRFAEIIERGDVAQLLGPLAGVPAAAEAPVKDFRASLGHEPVPAQPQDARVAFVTYFTEEDDLLDFCPALGELPAEARARLLDRLHDVVPPRVVRSARIRSRSGQAVHLEMFGLFTSSRLIERAMQDGTLERLREQIDEAVEAAAARGATVVGFGGLSSVVTHNAERCATHRLALTTGNALTVHLGIQAIERGAKAAGLDLSRARLAVVGAVGNIGATYAACLASRVQHLSLIGRSRSLPRLQGLADELRQRGASVDVSEDLGALRQASLILSATNAARPIIEPEHLGPGPIVICDVAVPRDVSPRVAALRPDVRLIVGGAVQLPAEVNLDLVAGHLPRGHVYACMAETMILGLEGRRQHFSFGAIAPQQVEEIGRLAEKHGFELGGLESARPVSRAPAERGQESLPDA
ncbi:MAG: aminotransferase class III-fold pyridoxal phosphate-dependent enzyme [Myxococcota bacterium]